MIMLKIRMQIRFSIIFRKEPYKNILLLSLLKLNLQYFVSTFILFRLFIWNVPGTCKMLTVMATAATTPITGLYKYNHKQKQNKRMHHWGSLHFKHKPCNTLYRYAAKIKKPKYLNKLII